MPCLSLSSLSFLPLSSDVIEQDVVALFKYCQKGDVKSLNKLIQDIQSSRAEYFEEVFVMSVARGGKTPLMMACLHGHVEIVKILIELGVSLDDDVDFGNNSALFYAKTIPVLNTLIQSGININAVNDKGKTFLMDNCYSGNVEFVSALLDAKADITIRNKNGTCLMRACIGEFDRKGPSETNPFPEIIKMLIDADADVNIRAIQNDGFPGITPLIIACSIGAVDTCRILIETKADMNVELFRMVPLMVVACAHDDPNMYPRFEENKNAYPKIAKLLIDAKADMNIIGKDEYTAVELACHFNNLETVLMLLEAGATVSKSRAQNMRRNSPSIYMCEIKGKVALIHHANSVRMITHTNVEFQDKKTQVINPHSDDDVIYPSDSDFSSSDEEVSEMKNCATTPFEISFEDESNLVPNRCEGKKHPVVIPDDYNSSDSDCEE